MHGDEVAKSRTDRIRQHSAPVGTTSEELIKYVLVELDVSRKNHKEFQDEMPALVELMFDKARWELVFASYPITGIVNRFVHIWRIPDESTIVEVMREGAVSLPAPAAPKPGSLDEAFRVCYLGVQKLIERTNHTLMTSLPYDPTHVGFQSQTILLDATGEAFIIDHSRLRGAVGKQEFEGLTDLGDELEQVRRAYFTRVNRENEKTPKHEREAPPNKPFRKLPPGRIESLKELQNHLNRGSAVAHLKFENEQALLFNLASLKARSIFQAVEAQPPEKDVLLGKVTPPGDGKVQTPVERLLIAMPWGGVYDVKAQALQKLVQSIPSGHKKATDKALEPLRSGNVPIASIPTERDDIIGDGCACYVINLKSFR